MAVAMKNMIRARPISLILRNKVSSLTTPNSLQSPHRKSTILFANKQSNVSMAASVNASRTYKPLLSPLPKSPRNEERGFMHFNFGGNSFPDNISCKTISRNRMRSMTLTTLPVVDEIDKEEEVVEVVEEDVWSQMQEEARSNINQEPMLSSYYNTSILSQKSFVSALANHLAIKLSNLSLPCTTLSNLFITVLEDDPEIISSVQSDLRAVKSRDPACEGYVHCFLNFKGFLACQAHRVAHKLWLQNRRALALLIQNRVSESFTMDIHPGAKIGKGILFDHGTGVVIGETAVIGDNVSILHNVTLGGTGKASGDRHPKIGDGVLIGAGTCILGNIRVGEGAKIGACSVVLKDVPARTTAVGNPARLLGGKENPTKLDKVPSFTMDHTSHISEWSDYVI